MRALSSTLLLLGLCVGIAPSLRASVSFATGNGTVNGSSIVFNGGTFNVTATAFSTTGNSNTTLATATLGQYFYGLGVCNSNENQGIGGCLTSGPPEHAIGNQLDSGVSPSVRNYDFVLLQFSVPLTSIQMTLSPFGTTVDMDATYFTGNCTGACTPATFLTGIIGKADTTAGLGAITGVSGVSVGNYTGCTTGCNTNQVFTLGGVPASGVNWVLIGANTTNSDGISDYFKLLNMAGTSTVPEPATFGMAGAALAAIAFLRRKKKLSA